MSQQLASEFVLVVRHLMVAHRFVELRFVPEWRVPTRRHDHEKPSRGGLSQPPPATNAPTRKRPRLSKPWPAAFH